MFLEKMPIKMSSRRIILILHNKHFKFFFNYNDYKFLFFTNYNHGEEIGCNEFIVIYAPFSVFRGRKKNFFFNLPTPFPRKNNTEKLLWTADINVSVVSKYIHKSFLSLLADS